MTYTPKTQVNDADVAAFLNKIEDSQKCEEAFILLDIFTEVSGRPAKVWGSSIIGFGSYSYVSKSGCAGDWMRTGFAPRKAGFSIYVMPGYNMGMEGLLENLGKHKMGRSCITIKKLGDIDIKILEKIVKKGLEIMETEYPE